MATSFAASAAGNACSNKCARFTLPDGANSDGYDGFAIAFRRPASGPAGNACAIFAYRAGIGSARRSATTMATTFAASSAGNAHSNKCARFTLRGRATFDDGCAGSACTASGHSRDLHDLREETPTSDRRRFFKAFADWRDFRDPRGPASPMARTHRGNADGLARRSLARARVDQDVMRRHQGHMVADDHMSMTVVIKLSLKHGDNYCIP